MKEELLHFIWQSRTLMKHALRTMQGDPLEILHPGMLNTDAGPDFFNAKLKIGDTLWAGNVEIHLKSSDWKNHHHQTDKKYNNVILHVVYHHDTDIFYDTGIVIPSLELRTLIPPLMLRKYRQLQLHQRTIACEKIFTLPPALLLANWMERLLVERLQQKCAYLDSLLVQNNNHWEEAFYHLTARNFGMKTNAQAFEWLAGQLPIAVLARHKNSLTQIEALIFGTAGFLQDESGNGYISLMRREFDFLRKKYSLRPLDKSIWKFARTRPANFPTVRLAQFSSFIYQSSHMFSKVLEAKTLKDMMCLYQAEVNKKLDPFAFIPHPTKALGSELGDGAVELLLINTVLPVLFLYGKRNHQEELSERAMRFYEELNAEDNSITRFWISLGINVKSAFESQALIQLKNDYCDNLKCLRCIIGNEILLNQNE